jgi:hypothetical protein
MNGTSRGPEQTAGKRLQVFRLYTDDVRERAETPVSEPGPRLF